MTNPATRHLAAVPGGYGDTARWDLIELWALQMRARGLSDRTVTTRVELLRRLERDHPDLAAVTGRQLFAWWAAQGASASSRDTYRSHLRSFYGWAVDSGHVALSPAHELPAVKVPRRLPRPLTPAQLRTAVDAAAEPVRTWLLLAGYAGLRAAEIAALHGEDVDVHRMVLEVRNPKGGGVGQVAPLHPQLAAHLARTWPAHGPLWPGMTPENLSVRTGVHLKRATGDQRANLHACRHTFATELLRQTHDLRVVQTAMRHATPTSTAIYTLVDPQDVTAAVAGLEWSGPMSGGAS